MAGQWQLRRAAGIGARLDLALAHELTLFVERGGIADAGHLHPRDFALERLGCSWSHVQELMLLGKRLMSLPTLRAAFLAGALSRSRIRALPPRILTRRMTLGACDSAARRSKQPSGVAGDEP